MMETFRQMVNECIRIGLDNNISTLKKFSSNHYYDLKKYDIQSKYKLTAISQACGRLAQMKRAIKEGKTPKSPYIQKPYLVSCYGFKINGMLLSIPIGNRKYINIILNHHTQQILSDKSLRVKSFVITPDSISLCIQKEVKEIKCDNTIGIDRNLRNVTVGNHEKVTMYDMEDLPKITYRTKKVTSSFKRNDHRIRQKIYSKLGNRRARRTKQFLNRISKDIVSKARESNSIIILEDIKGIRKLYRKGNGQGNKHRGMMNSWPFYELQRQIQYKSAWEGIPIRFVSPVRTSILCPICGNRTRKDAEQHRQVWCSSCKRMMDRDVVATMNISYKGLQRFCNPSCDASEAMKGNLGMPVILRVDASKLGLKA
jgi:putative transposase